MVLDLLATTGMIVTAGIVAWSAFAPRREPARSPRTSAKFALPARPVSIATSNLRGSARARVALLEFSDFQCPYCANFFRETYSALDSEYIQTGKVLFAFHQFPLPIHRRAVPAAIAAACAARQGRFWPMHDSLFTDPSRLEDDDFIVRAKGLGLHPGEFSACFAGQAVKPEIDAAVAEAKALGVRSTPLFLAGSILPGGSLKVTEVLAGARPVDDFRQMLDALLRPQ